ncbi:transposable element Tcb1 transposase [Trichonephila clavipes]|nr:transposable element Tcb1 transposase [Trichonephila clavipes]
MVREKLQGEVVNTRLVSDSLHDMLQTLAPVFQNDNAPVHTSSCVKIWLHEHDDVVKHLMWRHQSSYLNIIECLWVLLRSKIRARFHLPRTLCELETALHANSEELSSRFIFVNPTSNARCHSG